MTYAEKLVEKAKKYNVDFKLQVVVNSERGLYLTTFDVEELIEQAMQAQREACLQNSIQAQKERFGLEHDDMSDWVKEAILNAEVQP